MKHLLRAAMIIGLIMATFTMTMDSLLPQLPANHVENVPEHDPWKEEITQFLPVAIAKTIKEYMVLPRNTEAPIECFKVNINGTASTILNDDNILIIDGACNLSNKITRYNFLTGQTDVILEHDRLCPDFNDYLSLLSADTPCPENHQDNLRNSGLLLRNKVTNTLNFVPYSFNERGFIICPMIYIPETDSILQIDWLKNHNALYLYQMDKTLHNKETVLTLPQKLKRGVGKTATRLFNDHTRRLYIPQWDTQNLYISVVDMTHMGGQRQRIELVKDIVLGKLDSSLALGLLHGRTILTAITPRKCVLFDSSSLDQLDSMPLNLPKDVNMLSSTSETSIAFATMQNNKIFVVPIVPKGTKIFGPCLQIELGESFDLEKITDIEFDLYGTHIFFEMVDRDKPLRDSMYRRCKLDLNLYKKSLAYKTLEGEKKILKDAKQYLTAARQKMQEETAELHQQLLAEQAAHETKMQTLCSQLREAQEKQIDNQCSIAQLVRAQKSLLAEQRKNIEALQNQLERTERDHESEKQTIQRDIDALHEDIAAQRRYSWALSARTSPSYLKRLWTSGLLLTFPPPSAEKPGFDLLNCLSRNIDGAVRVNTHGQTIRERLAIGNQVHNVLNKCFPRS
jgi:hypothetical protein